MPEAFFAKHKIKPQKIAVAVSGGADSLYAVLKANEELSSKGFEIIALTVDHGLRKTSGQEARFVADLMREKGIEHHILCWQGQKPTTGVEDKARIARYALLEEWCLNNEVKYLITAHHLYDQVETFFMRLQRGSGLDGLCGMKEITPFKSIYILRPFLKTNPNVFKTFLKKQNIKWVEDESNQDERLLRVKMRHFLPLFEKQTGISPLQIAQTMERLQCSRAYFETTVQKLIQNHFQVFNDKVYCCDSDVFCGFETEIQYRLLSFLIKKISRSVYPPEAEKLCALMKKIQCENFKSATLGHCRVIRHGNFVWILPEEKDSVVFKKTMWRDYIKSNPHLKKMKFPAAVKRFLFLH